MIIEDRLDLFNINLYVLIVPTTLEKVHVEEELKNNGHEIEITGEDDFFGYCQMAGNTICIVIFLDVNQEGFYGTAAHEISHAASYVMEYIQSECDELRSRICQFITNKLHEGIKVNEVQ